MCILIIPVISVLQNHHHVHPHVHPPGHRGRVNVHFTLVQRYFIEKHGNNVYSTSVCPVDLHVHLSQCV